ncbi:MAG TPA: hypothetical protein VKB19_01025 [Pedobacter sp.]|nr:hypothetical protein [Pedobacter sp.]
MENNIQNELQEEEIANIEQFQVGRIPSEESDQQNDPQNSSSDDEVELGFTEDSPGEDDEDLMDGDDDLDDDETEGDPADEDADFESPDDDPA